MARSMAAHHMVCPVSVDSDKNRENSETSRHSTVFSRVVTQGGGALANSCADNAVAVPLPRDVLAWQNPPTPYGAAALLK
jgi:hypothetical protein